NAENNTQVRDLSYRGFVRFTQRFSQREETATAGSEASKKSGIKNAYYSIQVDYSRRNQNVEDPDHKNNLFDYGYIGKYQRFRAPTYALHTASALGDSTYWAQTGFRDTLVTYVPGDKNPSISAMT